MVAIDALDMPETGAVVKIAILELQIMICVPTRATLAVIRKVDAWF